MIYASITAKLILTTAVLVSLIAPVRSAGQADDPVVVDSGSIVENEEVNQEVVGENINTSYGTGDCSDYETLVRSYDWPADVALEICRKESEGYAEAINPEVHKDRQGNVICTSSRGLMQMACIHVIGSEYTLEDLLDPEVNIAIAYKLWKSKTEEGKDGFCPWSTYSSAECPRG